ncbi:DUF1853 family protein [Leeuwenhoekiella aequorea]|uniref:DUF1853 family protein n=1 Tax=Leeuwenhoekiella aequorea TaxID=283736 RepID=UPI00352DF40E
MIKETKILQEQFTGFLKTGQLHFNEALLPYSSFSLEPINETLSQDFVMPENIRLGQRMEIFMVNALKKSSYNILAKNLQLIKDKTTLGELDFILKEKESLAVVHLEMVYKFYLYRPEISGFWWDKLIGPNAKDQLTYKLDKLKQQQFPIALKSYSKLILEEVIGEFKEIQQQLCFKAQIYIPVNFTNTSETESFRKCIAGTYYLIDELNLLDIKYLRFYIPVKNDWVRMPIENEITLIYKDFYKKMSAALEEQRSYMFWVKDYNSTLVTRHFVTWW